MDKKIRGKNPVWILLSIFVLWIYINTYVVLRKDEISISRYVPKSNSNSFYKKKDKFLIDDLVKIEDATHFTDIHSETSKDGIYGKYESQEIRFILSDASIIAWNCRPYTKKQVVEVLNFVTKKI